MSKESSAHSGRNIVSHPWSLETDEVARQLEVDLQQGLSDEESARRLQEDGPNRLREARGRTPLQIFFSQFVDLMIVLLVVAGVISALIGDWTDSILIAIIVLANASIGSVQEWKAEKAVEALRKLSQPEARVRRNGRLTEISVENVVCGDVLELRGGDFIPADARLFEAINLQADEAALTGESLPVEKTTTPLPQETSLPDRTCMLYAGTAVTQGHGKAVVAATAMNTELGNIATLLQETRAVQTPLQRRLAAMSKRLAVIVIVVCFVIFAAGVLRVDSGEWNRELFSTMLLTAVSLAVAAIPEGLPAVITIALALGSQKMSRRKAIVRKLSAVETLGSVDVICSDKTGTLTQNKMQVSELVPVAEMDEAFNELLRAGVLCNDAEPTGDGEILGTATEASILQAAVDRKLDPHKLRQEWPRLWENPFSSERKRMSTLHKGPHGERTVLVKGAAEAIIALCIKQGTGEHSTPLDEAARKQWLQKAEELAERGHRMLAVACREWERDRLPDDPEEAETSLNLLGLVGIIDPPRTEVADSIASCRSAGIRPVMITGDHRGTAKAIAEDLGLWQPGEEVLTGTELDQFSDEELYEHAPRVAVYARVSPEHKLRIVRAYQAHENVVSMTGDGVNDAPALKQADIGVAMGITGTDVAKEASEMILADDNFATIVAAVEEGRVVYDNIRKFVQYLLTANTGEILVILFAILMNLPLPLLPVHILWINLVTDGLPALALGFEPAERNLMQRKPRRRTESIFAGGMMWGIVLIGLLMSVTCMVVYQLSLSGTLSKLIPYSAEPEQHTVEYARSMLFMILSMFQLFYVLAIRSTQRTFFELGPFSNYRLTVAVLIGTALQFAVIYVPALQKFFHTVPLETGDLVLAIAVSTLAFVAVEITKLIRRR